MADVRDIKDIGINIAPLNVLHPNNATVRIAAYQCGGVVLAVDSVKQEDQKLAFKKFTEFLKAARANSADLAITPEYSCPWNVIVDVIHNLELQPLSGALWVIGCESITPKELNELKDETSSTVSWHFESPQINANQKFLDPVVHLLRLAPSEGDKLCLIVQFKSEDMGGTTFERDNMINGTIKYLFHNKDDKASIRLMTYICADVLRFKLDEIEPHKPYLIIHPQLTPDPYHSATVKFRKEIYGSGNGENCEIIAVNWSRDTKIKKWFESSEFSGSAHYMSERQQYKYPAQNDEKIQENHIKGIYLKFSDTYRYAAFQFSPIEAVYIYDTPKVSQYHAAPQQVSHSGITAHKTYQWITNTWSEAEDIDDGITTEFQKILPTALMSTVREKLVCMSLGDLNTNIKSISTLPGHVKKQIYPSYWHRARDLNSYRLNPANESPRGTICRVQKCQDEEVSSALAKFSNLTQIVNNPSLLPENLHEFKNNPPVLKIIYEPTDAGAPTQIKHNAQRVDGKGNAALMYIGDALPQLARAKHDELKDWLSPQRLAIWFHYNGKTNCVSEGLKSITDINESATDIAGEGNHE